MIFKEIHIDGFGIFNNYSLINLRQGVNIILGNNEAGKSTLLKFLRYTLFGYPSTVGQRMPPLNGGDHRGRIIALLSNKKNVTFERIAGSSGGKIKLLYDGSSDEDQFRWNQLLGNATKDIFENVYAFSLDELTDLDKLSASGVEDKIFSVGLGLGKISISDVEGNIQKQVEDIYTQRGKIQIIPSIIKEINTKKEQIQKIQDNLPIYRELNSKIKRFEDDIHNIKTKLKEWEAERTRLGNYLKCYDSFIHIINCDGELETLPELQEYPGDGIENIRDLEKEEHDLNDKIRGLRDGNQEENGIEELKKEISHISFNSVILESKEKVEYLAINLEKYRLTVSDRIEDDGKIDNHDRLIKQKLKNINAKWTEKDIIDFSDIISHQDRIDDFKRKFNEIENNKIKIEGQRNALQTTANQININTISVLISLIFIIGSITAFYYLLYVLGASMIVISLLVFFLGRKSLLKDKSQGSIQHLVSDLNDKEEKLKSEYEKYLTGLNLQKSLTTDAVLEIFRTINQVKKDINIRDELKIKQEEQRSPFIKKFEEETNSLKEIQGFKESADNIELLVNQIVKEFNTAEEKSRYKEELQKKSDDKQKELESTKSKLVNIEKQLATLLKSINAKDREDFRKKYEEESKVKKLIESRKDAIANIETVVGLNKSGEVIEFLKTRNKEDIEMEKWELDENIGINNLELDVIYEEIGKTKKEVSQIEGESELAEIMTELESEKQKLHSSYKDWIAGKIALKLLEDEKSKFEKEKQPDVIKNSNAYFSKITGERYKRINVSQDEKVVSVFDKREASKKIEQLSRGTKEQLLISLRLGFIEEYERKAEPLPLIVDEVLVNFDPKRAGETAGILHEFGKNRQILIFTCHPETLEYFKRMNINRIDINENG